MQRNALGKLVEWKNSARRKPLIIKGARQVGKTWLMEEFAKTQYEDYIYISFDKDIKTRLVFEETKDPALLLERLCFIKNKPIVPGKTLLILDEIQDCPNALGSLKYFNEEQNEYHIVSAGSLLGTYLAKDTSFPVGKVNILDIYPLTFDEFLAEIDGGMYRYYHSIKTESDFVNAFHERMLELYREYLIIGGMPECVKAWIDSRNPREVSAIQKELVRIYEHDFIKYNSKIGGGKILQVFRNIIPQLAKENSEKFVYSSVREGARGRDFEDAVEWLVTSGVALKVNNLSAPEYPLNVYSQNRVFKLFLLDVGLVKYMSGIHNESILLNENFNFKGQLTENYVVQQLVPQMEFMPNYFSPDRSMEIDFLIQNGSEVIPLEAKSGLNKNAKSFKKYIDKYAPETAIRFSINGFVKNGNITNIPLYLASKTMEMIRR
ncbi:MAG: AAA family ATPase [Acidobacteriota bacterium]|jgi:predicted AAA+ superfamily ATPase|nr:AAA family ATPase [Acidobacteriota bacterium]